MSHDTVLSLGSLATPLLKSGFLDYVTVMHKNHGGTATLLEARVSLQEGTDRVKIVELKSSDDVTCKNRNTEHATAVASISGVIPIQGFIVSMVQLENDLHIWNSMHAFVLGQMRIERVHSMNVCYQLDDTHRGSLPVSMSRMPEEIYYYLEHAASTHSGGQCCSHGISDVIMKDSSGCYWGAIACLVSASMDLDGSSPQDTHVRTLSVFNSTPETIHSNIVQMLSKCAWSRKGGFTFRSSSGALPVSITRQGKGEQGSWCSCISRIVLFLYPIPGDDYNYIQSKKNVSMTIMIRSALNNAIQQLWVNMNTRQPQWADTAKPGTEAVTTLIESLTDVLRRANDSSNASQMLLLAMKRMHVSTMDDAHTKLREMVVAMRS